jgi:predicted nucleic acid-binding protein
VSDLQAAVVDTDVFSVLFVRRGSGDPRIARWRELLTGRQVLISFQTRTELLAGALADGWGERRAAALREILDRTPTIGVDDAVIDAHAALYAQCRRRGHALHNKSHTGDRWIAACAVAKGVDLLAGDDIYRGAPGLTLLA